MLVTTPSSLSYIKQYHKNVNVLSIASNFKRIDSNNYEYDFLFNGNLSSVSDEKILLKF